MVQIILILCLRAFFLIKSKLIVSAVFLWRFIFSDNKCMRGLMSLEYNIAMRSYPYHTAGFTQ